MRVQLRETPLLANLPEDALNRVAEATVFESYGSFDWYTDFNDRDAPGRTTRLAAAEPLIAAEGEPPAGLILIRSGFARLSRRHGHGHQTLAYLGKGQPFGLDELVAAHASGERPELRHSLRAIGYVDVVLLPLDVVIETVLPHYIPPPGERNRSKGQSAVAPTHNASHLDSSNARILRGTPLLQRHADDAHQPRSLHPLRRLRAGLRRHARQQPALRSRWTHARRHHGRERLHALRRPRLHDRLPHRRHRPRRRHGHRSHQRPHLHRLRDLRQ